MPDQSFFESFAQTPAYSRTLSILCAVISIALFIIAICLFVLTGRVVPFDYGIVIDAGSSHTEFYLYRWDGTKNSGTGDVVQENTCIYDDGIANLPDPTVVLNCTNKIKTFIPTAKQAQTPLYLAATAGMRLLNYTDPEEVNLRLLSLRCALKQTGLYIMNVNVISGYDEGLYSWITVNFLQDSLNPKKVVHSWYNTYGALDLGGASTQFSLAVNETFQKADKVTHLKLYGNIYNVVSHSFLCFGSDQIFLRHEAMLINDFNSSDVVIDDPCLPKGNLSIHKATDLLGSPCTSNPKFKHWLKVFDSENKTFTFQGTSDFSMCKVRIDNLLNETNCSAEGFMKCPEKVNISSSNLKFMAFSGFSFVTTFLNATNASLEEMKTVTENWCKLSWEEIKQHPYKHMDYPHLAKYCFGGVYITQWLTEIYGFDETSWKNLIFQDEIRKSDIGWSLGYMINATNAIPEEKISDPVISVPVFVVLLLFSVVVFGITCIFFFKYVKSRERSIYLPFDN